MDRLLSMRAFERVVDEGGFAAASRALEMSAPVVTRLIADLEEHLGTRLLQRSTRRVSLTEAGSLYLARVRNILQEIDEAEAATSAHTVEMAGRLRVYAPPVLASYIVAPILRGFRELYPKIVVDIEVSSINEPPIEDFDVTLLGTDNTFDANIIARKLVESDALLVASPRYLKLHGTPRSPDDLASHACLRLKASNASAQYWNMSRPGSNAPDVQAHITPVLLANHTDTLLHAAIEGAGITSVAADIAAPYLIRGELVRVLAPWITGRLVMYAAFPSRKFMPQRAKTFLDYLAEQARARREKALALSSTISR